MSVRCWVLRVLAIQAVWGGLFALSIVIQSIVVAYAAGALAALIATLIVEDAAERY